MEQDPFQEMNGEFFVEDVLKRVTEKFDLIVCFTVNDLPITSHVLTFKDLLIGFQEQLTMFISHQLSNLIFTPNVNSSTNRSENN